jgi:hypothetical protein
MWLPYGLDRTCLIAGISCVLVVHSVFYKKICD